MPWHHQCEGQRRAEDLLCSHRDDSISVARDCDVLESGHIRPENVAVEVIVMLCN